MSFPIWFLFRGVNPSSLSPTLKESENLGSGMVRRDPVYGMSSMEKSNATFPICFLLSTVKVGFEMNDRRDMPPYAIPSDSQLM